jgi:hypothetical protein
MCIGEKKKMLDDAKDELVRRMDIVYFLKKLDDLEKIKKMLLTDD